MTDRRHRIYRSRVGGLIPSILCVPVLAAVLAFNAWAHAEITLAVAGVLFVGGLGFAVRSAYLQGCIDVRREQIDWLDEHRAYVAFIEARAREVQRREDALAGKFHGPS